MMTKNMELPSALENVLLENNLDLPKPLMNDVKEQERLLGETSEDVVTCDGCDEGDEAVWRCLDCDAKICHKQNTEIEYKSPSNNYTNGIIGGLDQFWSL